MIYSLCGLPVDLPDTAQFSFCQQFAFFSCFALSVETDWYGFLKNQQRFVKLLPIHRAALKTAYECYVYANYAGLTFGESVEKIDFEWAKVGALKN